MPAIQTFGQKGTVWEAFSGKRLVCCPLLILYSTYNTVGLSVASIHNLGNIFTSGHMRII